MVEVPCDHVTCRLYQIPAGSAIQQLQCCRFVHEPATRRWDVSIQHAPARAPAGGATLWEPVRGEGRAVRLWPD